MRGEDKDCDSCLMAAATLEAGQGQEPHPQAYEHHAEAYELPLAGAQL